MPIPCSAGMKHLKCEILRAVFLMTAHPHIFEDKCEGEPMIEREDAPTVLLMPTLGERGIS